MIIYLIKLSLSLAVITSFYWLLLRKLTFYKWNRIYLLAYSMLAFVLPFLDVYDFLNPAKNAYPVVEAVPVLDWSLLLQNGYGAGETSFFEEMDAWKWTGLFVFAGMLFCIVRLAAGMVSFFRMKKKAVLLQDGPVKVFAVPGKAHFSFGNNIFINPEEHSDAELQRIVLHEFVHVRQKHTVDLMWAELLCLIMWFNPCAWLLRRAIRQNLEFLADEEVLKQGVAPKEYQLLLLKVMSGLPHRFVAPFGFSFLKKRIVMMNKNKTARIHAIRFLFVLPLLATIVLSFRSIRQEQEPKDAVSETSDFAGISAHPSVPGNNEEFFKRNPSVAGLGTQTQYGKKLIFIQLKSGEFEYYDFSKMEEYASFKEKYGPYPVSEKTYADLLRKQPGVAGWSLKGDLIEVNLRNGNKENWNTEDEKEMEAFRAKYQFNQPVPPAPPVPPAVSDTVPPPPPPPTAPPTKVPEVVEVIVTGEKVNTGKKTDVKEVVVIGYPTREKTDVKEVVVTGYPARKKTDVKEVVVTGYRTPKSGNEEASIDASLSQPRSTQNPIVVRGYPTADTSRRPLYVLDGKVMPASFDINSIDVDIIQSISVLKDENSTKVYGPRGINGVIEIYTGKSTAATRSGITIKTTEKEQQVGNLIKIRGGNDFNGIYVVDGKIHTPQAFQDLNLNPDTIESINVWKGDSAEKKYGEKGKNGVIEIQLK